MNEIYNTVLFVFQFMTQMFLVYNFNTTLYLLKVVSTDELWEINEQLNVKLGNKEEFIAFLKYLHTSGDIIYYKLV